MKKSRFLRRYFAATFSGQPEMGVDFGGVSPKIMKNSIFPSICTCFIGKTRSNIGKSLFLLKNGQFSSICTQKMAFSGVFKHFYWIFAYFIGKSNENSLKGGFSHHFSIIPLHYCTQICFLLLLGAMQWSYVTKRHFAKKIVLQTSIHKPHIPLHYCTQIFQFVVCLVQCNGLMGFKSL